MTQDTIKASLARAVEAVRAGRLDEAARILESGGGAVLKTSVGQNIRGDILLRQGQYQDALKAFDIAVRLSPSAPEAYCNRGVALESLGRLDEALAAQDRALRYRPDYATAHFNRGNVLKALGRLDEAIAAYGRALMSRPGYAEALVNRGAALLATGKPLDALSDFGQALTTQSNLVAAQLGRATAYRDLGQSDMALAVLAAARRFDPDNPDIARLRHRVLFMEERYEEALMEVDAVIEHESNDAAARRERARTLLKLERFDEALAAADEAVRLAPRDSDAQVVRGEILNETGRIEESFTAIEAARQLGAAGKAFLDARGVANALRGDPRQALADLSESLAIDPDDALTHYNRALVRIAIGEWQEGWAEHEWRLQVRRRAPPPEIRQIAAWTGEPLTGKRLLVYADQGHGDTLQFVRFLRLLRRDAAAITVRVQRAVRPLLEANFPDFDVTDALAFRTDFDYRASLMSMPAIFGTTLETLPATVPYLAADPERVTKWRRRLAGGGVRVGVIWQGSRLYARDRDRSVPLAAFAPLARVPGVRLISVQAMVGLEQLEALPEGMKVERLGEEIENNPDGFREMAAAMANLDLVIASDTGPTHLAGALGRPVWLATSRYPDWRWMHEREDTPWYPTMRLFRQERAGEWAGVFSRMAAELSQAVVSGDFSRRGADDSDGIIPDA